jgi:hypothetical protein
MGICPTNGNEYVRGFLVVYTYSKCRQVPYVSCLMADGKCLTVF